MKKRIVFIITLVFLNLGIAFPQEKSDNIFGFTIGFTEYQVKEKAYPSSGVCLLQNQEVPARPQNEFQIFSLHWHGNRFHACSASQYNICRIK